MFQIRKKKGFLDKRQKAQTAKNTLLVNLAIQEIRASEESETLARIVKLTRIPKTTAYKYLRLFRKKEEKEKRSKIEEWKSAFIHTILLESEPLIAENDPLLQEMLGKIKELNSSFVKGFIHQLIHGTNGVRYKRTERLNELFPFFRRRIHQLESSLTIKTGTNQKAQWFEEEVFKRLMDPIIRLFYRYFFGLGLYRHPERFNNKPIKITIEFDPFKGTLDFLSEEIKKAEWRLVNGRFRDFHETIAKLEQDDIEHYRLKAIANGTFNQKDFETYKTSKVKKAIRNRISEKRVELTDPRMPLINWNKLKGLLDAYAR